jgi:hypothetical protein
MNDTPTATITCPNCGEALRAKYCAHCGQKRIDKHELGVRHFFGHIVHEITHLDSNKIARTAGDLLFKPGHLTREYLAGRRGRHINPIRVYLTVSAIYFLFAWGALVTAGGGDAAVNSSQPWLIAQAQRKNVDPAVFAAGVKEKAGKYSGFLRFASVLVSGLFLMLLFRGSGRYYVEHLIFSLHFYAFDFLMKCIVAVVYLTSSYHSVARSIYYVITFAYLLFALLRVYGESLVKTTLKTTAQFALEVALFFLINIMGFVLAVAFYG